MHSTSRPSRVYGERTADPVSGGRKSWGKEKMEALPRKGEVEEIFEKKEFFGSCGSLSKDDGGREANPWGKNQEANWGPGGKEPGEHNWGFSTGRARDQPEKRSYSRGSAEFRHIEIPLSSAAARKVRREKNRLGG